MRIAAWRAVSVAVLAAGLAAAAPARAEDATAAAADETVTIVALGDSLTAGYQLAPGEGFVAQLEAALKARGHDVAVVDAGVSGDTTSGGLSRLDWSIGPEADAVIVELGGNDALRGLDPATTEQNLDAILTRLDGRGLPVLLAGMLAPPNLGEDYADAFNPIFARLAEKHGTLHYPFFLEGVAAEPDFGLGDGIHPNARGVAVIVERILPDVEALIARAKSAGGA
jgi:acyl-CoA thioesterase I